MTTSEMSKRPNSAEYFFGHVTDGKVSAHFFFPMTCLAISESQGQGPSFPCFLA